MPTPTFWLEPTGKQMVGLRRYHAEPGTGAAWRCEDGWHQAVTWLPGDFDEKRNERGHWVDPIPEPPDDDPQWPTHCEAGCRYAFTETDHRQVFSEALWRRADNGQLRVLHTGIAPPGVQAAEPGAMWDADWMGAGYRGPDGVCLMVRCPRPDGTPGGNDWTVDATSRDGGRWTRSGDPRLANVTVSPSIAIGVSGEPGYYHGFLQAGVLTDHIG